MDINKANKIINHRRGLALTAWMNEGNHPDEWPGHDEPLYGVTAANVEAAILHHVQPLRDEIAALKRQALGVYSVRELEDAYNSGWTNGHEQGCKDGYAAGREDGDR